MIVADNEQERWKNLKLPIQKEIIFFIFFIKEKLHDHTQTHHTRHDSSGRVISPTQKPLRDKSQNSQERNIHAPQRDSNPQSLQANGRRPTP
jgi:hypothetical protein